MKIRCMPERVILTFTLALVPVFCEAAGAGGPFTTEQADAGRSAYLAHCASCHLPDLAGRNEASSLTGSSFVRAWSRRTTNDLLAYIRAAMPPGNRGNLGDENYISLVAFLLSANGAPAGDQPLTISTQVAIGSVATGLMPAALKNVLDSTTADVPGLMMPVARPTGLLVTGQVK